MKLFVSNEKLENIIIFLLFILLQNFDVARGQVKNIKTPEGICKCPKQIAEVFLPTDVPPSDISCFIDSVGFVSPNWYRAPIKPKLFAVKVEGRPCKKSIVESAHPTNHLNSKPYPSTSNNSQKTKSPIATSSYAIHSTFNSTAYEMTSRNREYFLSYRDATASQQITKASVTSSNPIKFSSLPTTTSLNSYLIVSNNSKNEMTLDPSKNSPIGTLETIAISEEDPGLGVCMKLYQTHDFDREKQDKYFVTVQCPIERSQPYKGIFVIEVTDINDNSPVFDAASLQSVVNANITNGDVLLQMKATDADIGENANLTFGGVKGTEQITFQNGTKVDVKEAVTVLQSGFAFLRNEMILLPDTLFTFGVSVKDRAKYRNEGYRVTATATVSIFGTNPVNPTTKPYSTTPNSTDDYASHQWIVSLVLSVALSLVLLLLVMFWAQRKRRNRLAQSRMLVDNRSSLLRNDELSRFEDYHHNAISLDEDDQKAIFIKP